MTIISKFITLLLVACVLVGCASFSKKLDTSEHQIITSNRITALNGNYDLLPFKAIRNFENGAFSSYENLMEFNLFDRLHKVSDLNPDKSMRQVVAIDSSSSNLSVKIGVNDGRIINFSLLQGNHVFDSLKSSYLLKRNGFVYLRRSHFRVNGVPLLYGGFEQSRLRIGLTISGELVLDRSDFIYGAALLIIGDTRRHNSRAIFERQD